MQWWSMFLHFMPNGFFHCWGWQFKVCLASPNFFSWKMSAWRASHPTRRSCHGTCFVFNFAPPCKYPSFAAPESRPEKFHRLGQEDEKAKLVPTQCRNLLLILSIVATFSVTLFHMFLSPFFHVLQMIVPWVCGKCFLSWPNLLNRHLNLDRNSLRPLSFLIQQFPFLQTPILWAIQFFSSPANPLQAFVHQWFTLLCLWLNI